MFIYTLNIKRIMDKEIFICKDLLQILQNSEELAGFQMN